MLGNRTRGGRMEGVNKSTELWRHPISNNFCFSLIANSYLNKGLTFSSHSALDLLQDKWREVTPVSAHAVSCCVCDKPKISYAAHAWQLSIHVCTLGWSCCLSLCAPAYSTAGTFTNSQLVTWLDEVSLQYIDITTKSEHWTQELTALT